MPPVTPVIVRVAVCDDVPIDAVIASVLVLDTTCVWIVLNVRLVVPANTVTLDGSATAEAELFVPGTAAAARVTETPPEGAIPLNVTVAETVFPPTTVVGVIVKPVTPIGLIVSSCDAEIGC